MTRVSAKRSTVRSRADAIPLTPESRAVLDRIVDRAKRAITADVEAGVVPRSVRTVGGLGSYVDQNVYFLTEDESFDPEVEAMQIDLGPDGVDSQPMYDFLTLAMDRVEAWMKGGGLRRVAVARRPLRRRSNPSPYVPADIDLRRAYGSFSFGGKLYRGEPWEHIEVFRGGRPVDGGIAVTTSDGIAWVDGKVYRVLSHDWDNGEIVVSGLARPSA